MIDDELTDLAALNRLRGRCRRYGLDLDDFIDMWSRQHGRCGICRCIFTSLRAARIDHDHDPDRDAPENRRELARGLLCNGCNANLPSYEESEIEQQLAWLEHQVAEAHRRLDLYHRARPLYLRAVHDYLQGSDQWADGDSELLQLGRKVPWQHHDFPTAGLDAGVGIMKFTQPRMCP